MENIQLKYNLLDAASRKEVSDLVDFLLSKREIKSKIATAYKKKILQVSTWDEHDLKHFDEARQHINNWKIEEW